MEYGEKLYRIHVWPAPYRHIPFRYRVDPVPGVNNRWRFANWYKNFRVYKRERSLYNEHKEFVRNKRSPYNLPDPWDDKQRGDVRTRKSWKNKKIRKQYMKNMAV